MTRREPVSATWQRRFTTFGVLAVVVTVAGAARATICKYVDADGNVVYSNVAPAKGLRKLSCEIADDGPARKPAATGRVAATPSNFPRVERETQKSRDDKRRQVLDDELASEQKLLEEARIAYGNGAPPPLPDEQNDAEKYRQRIARLRQSVLVHERNIEALRKEIAVAR